MNAVEIIGICMCNLACDYAHLNLHSVDVVFVHLPWLKWLHTHKTLMGSLNSHTSEWFIFNFSMTQSVWGIFHFRSMFLFYFEAMLTSFVNTHFHFLFSVRLHAINWYIKCACHDWFFCCKQAFLWNSSKSIFI